jgi:hypothetical protein
VVGGTFYAALDFNFIDDISFIYISTVITNEDTGCDVT